MVYSQKLFDMVMDLLDKKQQLLIEYYNVTTSVTSENLADVINDVVDKRQYLIEQIQICEADLQAIPKKLFGNDAHALSVILKHKVSADMQLPPILNEINKKCILIQNIMLRIKEADTQLNNKVQMAKQDVMDKIEQVKNNKQVFYYRKKMQGQMNGNMLDEKR